MNKDKKVFKAIVYDENKQCFAKRITIEACSVDEAMRIMNLKYGEGNYIDLHNEDSANEMR